MQFNILLPKLTVDARIGGWAVDITLPALQLATAITIPILMEGNITLPLITTSGYVNVGTILSFNLTLPALDADGQINEGLFGSVVLPALRAQGQFVLANTIGGGTTTTDIELPPLRISGHFSSPVPALFGYVILPALTTLGGSTLNSTSSGIKLPALLTTARIVTDFDSPSFQTRRAWVMNLSNNAVTEYSRFEFRAFGRAFNQIYAIGIEGGLYLIGGDVDEADLALGPAAKIDWEWSSGMTDFNVAQQKGMLAVYVDGLFEKGALFTLESDGAKRIYEHRFKGNPSNHMPHRVPFGRGVRSRNFALGMYNPDGGYLELDKITPEYHIIPRNL
jgi:hypothetical protein